jgi:hypothetical protein
MLTIWRRMSPEIFPAKDRGTGNALTATATRVFGVMVRHLVSPAYRNVLIRCRDPTGAHYRTVCKSRNRGPRIRKRRAHHGRRAALVGVAF